MTVAQLLDIAQLGNPVLRSPAQPVTNVHDPSIQSLIDNLTTTVAPVNGVGLAAPQVSKSYRLFLLASRPTVRYPYAPHMEPTAIINPHILSRSHEIVKDWEGCLSIPGIRGLVPRSEGVEVEYTDRWGKLQRAEFSGFVARVFQHEYDHLDGIVFLDRVENNRDIVTETEYYKHMAFSSIAP
jgi:peptide deformylase